MRRGKLDSLGVSAFCESMAMMVQSGIQMDEAVALLRSGSGQGGPLEEGLVIMQAETEAGKGLSAAMEATGLFPEYCLRMVLAGEKAGRLEDVLFQLARYYEDQKAMTGKLQSAVLYPVAMLGLIIIVLIVMLAMVLPAFTDVYDSLTGSLTASAYGYVRWAYALCWAALAVMAALAVILALGFALWNAGKRNSVEKILHRIPVCASILDSLGMFRFTAALSTFLASGEIQDIAVAESRKMASCRPVEERIDRCVSRMEQGHGIAQAAYDERLFEPVYGRMLLAGERSGSLESVLRKLTGLLADHCTDLVDRLVGIVDPVLSGVLMLAVGLSLLSVMLPLIGMMNSMG
ncbi:type II secretion system F family protein [uncultured Acetatifactor sp.]|uniref:type II secretion system F family protein n=1 Tax=uncultured Acetatifactor sp. TaxID=1671927 RepID=UPI00262E92A2|nr:type II secretion system F family protein [uncultured Acetatifactor sp.]